jgi:hypothetical protein
MTESTDPRAALDASIDAIEAGYEYLLAYAAQGRHTDRGGGSGDALRGHLGSMERSLAGLADQARACAAGKSAALLEDSSAYFAAVDTDAEVARAAVRLVLAQSDISSQLIDNLNASIHLRAVLTDIFLLDEALRPQRN